MSLRACFGLSDMQHDIIRVTAFRWVPSFAQGFVRDLRVRWALEEAGLPYEVRLIGREEQRSSAYRAQQPYGQVPVYEERGLTLFESGAIVQHIADKSEVLMPSEPAARARTIAWMFSALNSIEPFVMNLAEVDIFQRDAAWASARRPVVVDDLRGRLRCLATWLDGREYLEEDRFTAADLLMATILREVARANLMEDMPQVDTYHRRCISRPAFERAHAAQMRDFAGHQPPD